MGFLLEKLHYGEKIMTYEEYLIKSNDAINFEQANVLFEKMQTALESTDEDAKELFDDFLEAAIEYASIRSKWLMLSKKEKMDSDKSRTLKHDTLIIRLNVLIRYLDKIGRNVSWKDELGDSRKRIGDFACYIALLYGLSAR